MRRDQLLVSRCGSVRSNNPHLWPTHGYLLRVEATSVLLDGPALGYVGTPRCAIARSLPDELMRGIRQTVQGAIAQEAIIKEGQPVVYAVV
jgi:hypothetical protein